MPKSEFSISVLVASPFPEDSSACRFACRAFALDWRVLTARTCREAWTALHREEVDVVIAEAEFPDGVSWRELLDEIENMHGCQPVIVASDLADERLWAEVLNLGGFDLLAKPFDPEELVRVIAMAARSAAQMRREAGQRTRRLHALSGAVA